MMIWISGYDDFRGERWHLLQKSKVDCHNSTRDKTRSLPIIFIITLSRIFVITLNRIFVKFLHDLHHKWPHHSKTACCSPKDLDPSLSTRLLWGKTRNWGRERKSSCLISLNSVKYCFPKFLNSSDLRPRIMKGQVKDKLRNKLISASWNSAWLPFIITSLLFLFTFVTVNLQNRIVAMKTKNFVRNMKWPH